MSKRKKKMHKGRPLNVWINTELRAAVDDAKKKSRRSLTEEVSIALEQYLKELGLWPPRTDPSEQKP